MARDFQQGTVVGGAVVVKQEAGTVTLRCGCDATFAVPAYRAAHVATTRHTLRCPGCCPSDPLRDADKRTVDELIVDVRRAEDLTYLQIAERLGLPGKDAARRTRVYVVLKRAGLVKRRW